MMKQEYPKAAKHPEIWKCGAHEIKDDYLYMTDPKNPEVVSWVSQENAYTDAWFEDKKLAERIKFLKNKQKGPSYHAITEQDDVLYASCHDKDRSPSAVLLGMDFSQKKVLLNRQMMGNEMQVFNVFPCPANRDIAAFMVLKDGAARPTALVRDIKKNETLAELSGTFSCTWSDSGAYLYSSTAQQREDGTTQNIVQRWNMNTQQVENVYTCPGHAVFLTLAAGKGEKIFVHVCRDYHDVGMVCLNQDGTAVKVIEEETSHKDYIGSIANKHYFKTDSEALLSRIVCVEENEMHFSDIQEVIEEGKFPLTEACVAGDKLLLVTLEDAVCRLKQYDENGNFLQEIALPDAMGSLSLQQFNGENSPYMSFESFNCPPSVLKYHADSSTVGIVYQESHKPQEDIVVEQKFVTARDGRQVMAFLVYKKGIKKDSKCPTLIYGYGGYSSNQLPWYNNPFIGLDIVDWAQRGGLYVHCILRGGEEYGKTWHEEGCGLNKKNVFYDFIDITKSLIADGWTNPEHIAICGGSNGGLLTTALTTMEPSLWKCVIASVPHTDMLHFSCDDRGPMYVTEYGDPRTEECFEYMKSYSPYHNIKEGTKYPFVYVQTGEQDNNVPPYHGKKFAAALQQATAGESVLLRVLPYGSHDRGTGEYFYRTTAEMQTFIEYALGMSEQSGGK